MHSISSGRPSSTSSLVDAQTGQAIDLGRAFEQRCIEPATAARAPGRDAFFGAHGAHVVKPGVPSFHSSSVGNGPHPAGAIGLGDAQDVVQHAGPHTDPAAALPATQLPEVT